MYNRRRQQQQQQPKEEQEEVGDSYSGSEDEQQQRFETREPVQGSLDQQQPEVPRHLGSDVFSNVKKVWLDIDLVATPEELANGQKSTTWKLLPHLPGRHLKQNMATKDRHLAGDEDLAGDLRQCIPIEFKITEHSNSFPFPIGIQAPGMMPKTLHRHGACLWRVQPGTAPTMVGEKAFEPVNVIDEHMYENYAMCTLESLDADIALVPAKGKQTVGYGRIATNSVAYKTLITNLNRGAWAKEAQDMDMQTIYEAPERHVRSVEVPLKVAEDIRNTLRPIVEETIKRCVDLENMNFEIVRADGNPHFNSPQGFIGELVGVADNKLKSKKLMTTARFHVKGEFSFVLMG
jgi:hypothetical protein